jgi:hypothetical protein
VACLVRAVHLRTCDVVHCNSPKVSVAVAPGCERATWVEKARETQNCNHLVRVKIVPGPNIVRSDVCTLLLS